MDPASAPKSPAVRHGPHVVEAVPLRRTGGIDSTSTPPFVVKHKKKATFVLRGAAGKVQRTAMIRRARRILIVTTSVAVLVALVVFIVGLRSTPKEEDIQAAAADDVKSYLHGGAFGAGLVFGGVDCLLVGSKNARYTYIVRGQLRLSVPLYDFIPTASLPPHYLELTQQMAEIAHDQTLIDAGYFKKRAPATLPPLYEAVHTPGETVNCRFQLEAVKLEGKWIIRPVDNTLSSSSFRGYARPDLPTDAIIVGTTGGDTALTRQLKVAASYVAARQRTEQILVRRERRELADESNAPAAAPVVHPLDGLILNGEVSYRGEKPTPFRAVFGKFDPALGLTPVVFSATGTTATTTCEARLVRYREDGGIEATLSSNGLTGVAYASAASQGVSRFFTRGTGVSFELFLTNDAIKVTASPVWRLTLALANPGEKIPVPPPGFASAQVKAPVVVRESPRPAGAAVAPARSSTASLFSLARADRDDGELKSDLPANTTEDGMLRRASAVSGNFLQAAGDTLKK